jgi:tetratricopeptide (TPR) repeat protein
MSARDRLEQAGMLYERAVFGGDADALPIADRELDSVEADLALARGRIIHARFLDQREEDARELPLFERAAELYRALGDIRGEAESLFWIGCFHQVVRDDRDLAIPALERSQELAGQVGDKLTMSYALRHLGFAERTAGTLDKARELLDESTKLRQEIGFMPGVAANLVALAYLAGEQGRPDDALALVEEAGAIATASDASAVARWADEARSQLRGEAQAP